MTRDVGGVLLVLVGGAILRLTTGDAYLRYVKDSLRPWLVASGVILVVLGAWAIVDVVRAARAEHRHPGDDHGPGVVDAGDTGELALDDATDGIDDGHGHGPARTAWLLVVPVLAIFLVAPPALGAYTAERQAAVVTAPASGYAVPPLAAGDPVVVALSDYAARAVWDDGRTLAGRTVSLTGFASAGPHGTWYLTRLSLTCCAADAVATKITVVDAPSTPATNTWVTVVGQWVPGGGTQSETAIPWVKASSMTAVPVPRDPYE